jgi:hypothetical protein
MSTTGPLPRKEPVRDLAREFGSWVRQSRAAQVVLLANLVALVGAVFLQWNAFEVVFLYWLENLVIGALSVLKMIFAHGGGSSYVDLYRRYPHMLIALPAVVLFFILHYGFACDVHGFFVFSMFDKDHAVRENLLAGVQSELTGGVLLALAALIAEHAYMLYRDFWKRGDYARFPSMMYMFAPYARVAIVHCSLLLGAILSKLFSAPAIVVAVLLIVLKVGPELYAVHIGQRMGEYAKWAASNTS